MEKGKLIVLEGLDGTGKATQARIIKETLEKKGKTVVNYAYPNYESKYGKIIGSFLRGDQNLDVGELFLLYLIDMVNEMKSMKDNLNSGKFVIVDRFFFSTIAYQSSGGFDYEKAKEIVQILDMPRPDIVLLLDANIDVSSERKSKQKEDQGGTDRFEKDVPFLQKVKQVYYILLKEKFYAGDWVLINSGKTVEEVSKPILAEVEKLF